MTNPSGAAAEATSSRSLKNLRNKQHSTLRELLPAATIVGLAAAAVFYFSKQYQDSFNQAYLADTPAAAINRGVFNEDTQQNVYRVAEVYQEKIQVWDEYIKILKAKQSNTATPGQEEMFKKIGNAIKSSQSHLTGLNDQILSQDSMAPYHHVNYDLMNSHEEAEKGNFTEAIEIASVGKMKSIKNLETTSSFRSNQ